MARPRPNLTIEQLKARSAMWVKKWRDKYPEKQALARKRAYLNRKLKAFRVIGEAKCKKCGCDILEFLEFNHINGGGCKERKIYGNVSMTDILLTKKRKIDGLEILCRVCNALDFLSRKNNIESKRFKIIWEKGTQVIK